MSGLGAFEKAAAAKPAKKGKTEKHAFSQDRLDDFVKQWIEAAAAEKQAKQDKAEAEAEILPAAEEERLKASLSSGANQSTVIVNGKLAVSQSKRYTKVPAENLPELREIFGDAAERFFKTRMNVSVKPSIMDNEAKLNELVDAIGAENIEKFFDVVQDIEVTEAFHNARSTDIDVQKKSTRAIEDGLVRPYKAAVKLN